MNLPEIDFASIQNIILTALTDIGLKIIAALLIWFIGRALIQFTVKLVRAWMAKRVLDPTVENYVASATAVILNILLIIGILGNFGLQTTSFAALFATLGITIGAAWAGLLANLAAGIFLIVLRPFKVGDFVIAGGINGNITQIGLFSTTITTSDNVANFVGNSKIFGDTIQNFSSNSYRRLNLKVQLTSGVDYQAAIALLREKVTAIPGVLPNPAVVIDIGDLNLVGPVLVVRPCCSAFDYTPVHFATNKVILETLEAAGFAPKMTGQNLLINQ
ncbi:MAG: mechanosensitive ion channel family protein [Polynucleobacter sp.]|jgi:small conductance mechanosensitive channel|nr:mechanosensitive ion channel family protein [Polynucleobacter sp.]